MTRPGTIVFQLNAHPIPKMERLARARGWKDGDSLFDYIEPEFYGVVSEFTELPTAVDAAAKYLKRTGDIFGCCQIFELRYEEVDEMPGQYEWETIRTYEVNETGITSDW
jgi:hypothetical protein